MKNGRMDIMNSNNSREKKQYIYIIFGIMVILQLGIIIYYFQFRKEGFHSDEIWSYGYSNSCGQMHIFQDDNGNLTYTDEWLDTQILRDYIVVNKGERFRYDSVYNNHLKDLSPPVHSFILHTICSLFPEKFSKWFSFSINIIAFFICIIYLFKIAKRLKGDVFALCCSALYGFSWGARDTYIYLRAYALCSALVMVFLYYLMQYLQIYRKDRKKARNTLIILSGIALVSFLTHYYLISFIGLLTFFVCVYLLFQKQIKPMLAYGFSMLGILVLTVVMFPTVFSVSQNYSENVGQNRDYNFEIRFRLLVDFITSKLFHIHIPMYKTNFWQIVMAFVIFSCIILVPLMYLFRNTAFMQWFIRRAKLLLKKPLGIIRYFFRRINWIYVIIAASVIGQIIVVGETSRIYGMADMVDRYLFFLYAPSVLIGMALLYQILYILMHRIHKYRLCLILISVLLVGLNQYECIYQNTYFFERSGKVDIEDCIRNRDCIFVRNRPWMLTPMVPVLMEAENFAVIQYDEYEELQKLYQEHKGERKVVVVVDVSFNKSLEDQLDFGEEVNVTVDDEKGIQSQEIYKGIKQMLENLEPDTDMEHLTTQEIFTRYMEVYLINP